MSNAPLISQKHMLPVLLVGLCGGLFSACAYLLSEQYGTTFGGLGFLVTLLLCAYIRQSILNHITTLKIVDDKTQQLNESLAELTKAKEEAEAGNIAKSVFLANMSHEIRTPLNGVLATAELLFNTDLSSQQKRYVEIMRSSGELLMLVINDILDFSKIEAGKIEINLKPLNVRHEKEIVASLYRAQAEARNLVLTFDVDDSVPRNVVSDPFRLRQVVSNLISNAIKYTAEGSVDAKFSMVGEEGARRLRFVVKDTGPGIPLDAHKIVFEKFTQIDRKESINGTGLGLPICRSLVELMGGQVDVESDGRNGSLFWFEIPVTYAPDDALTDKRMEIIFTRANHAGCRILLVEDIEMNRIVAAEMLRQLGCVVDTAVNGQLAVEALATASYDIVFMDCNMPVMNGYLATEAIRASGDTKTPIVALTAHTLQEEVDKCLAAGMNDFLSKPIKHDMLTRALDKWHNNTSGTACITASVEERLATKLQVPQAEDVPRFDYSTLKGWHSSSPEKAKKFIDLTLKDSNRLFDEIVQALSDNNLEEVREGAHALKSVAGQIGGLELQRLSREMEGFAKTENLIQAQELFKTFEPAYQAYVSDLSSFKL